MNANALQVLILINEGLKAAGAAQILANNHNEAVRRQTALLTTAHEAGRDITDAELAGARDWAMEQKRERDALLAQDRDAVEAERDIQAKRAGG